MSTRLGLAPRLAFFVLLALLPRHAGAEAGPIGGPAMPTHWKATREIGRGLGPVSDALLRAGATDPTAWLQYGGDYRAWRHSPVKQLTPASVPQLKVAWAFQTGVPGQLEANPIVYDGVLYLTSAHNRLFALDAKTGELLWRYDHPSPPDLAICCGPANRGVAIAGDLVLMATLDAHLMAFQRKTGEIAWNATIIDYKQGYSATSAPLVVGDLAVIGVGGGEFGIRGFFDAYDLATGERRWRHYTVPAAGEPGAETWAGDSWKSGGAPSWATGSYDAETDTLFWGAGNPSPDFNGDVREGDNLYSDSLLAVDPKTGARKWHFQFTPHDVWDYDGNGEFFLIDATIDGAKKKVVAQPNRNGYFYLLDRSDGKFLRATPYVEKLNWATIDANGRPVVDPTRVPVAEPEEPQLVCPGLAGGKNAAYAAAYSPDTGLAYVPVIESCQKYRKALPTFVQGIPFMGGEFIMTDQIEGKAWGSLTAVDVATGAVRWRYKDPHPMMAGALSTAGGVVFTGNTDGLALALDARTGKELWRFATGSGIRSQPVAYEVDGQAFVAIGSGGGGIVQELVGSNSMMPYGSTLFVFALPKAAGK